MVMCRTTTDGHVDYSRYEKHLTSIPEGDPTRSTDTSVLCVMTIGMAGRDQRLEDHYGAGLS